MSKDDNSKRTGVTPSDYVRAGILFTLNVGDRAEQLTDADVARIADSVDRRFGTEQSPRTALQVGQVITYEGDTPPDGWERVEAGSAAWPPRDVGHEHGICDLCLAETPHLIAYPALPLGTRCERHAGAGPGGGLRVRTWRSTPAGPDEVVFDLNATVAPEVFALVDDAQCWHEIATEGLPPTPGDYWVLDCGNVEHREWSGTSWHEVNRDPHAYAKGLTHWMAFVKPAPPTRES